MRLSFNIEPAEKPEKGLAIARMVGHITYLCEEAMHEKFARRFQDKDSPNFNFDIDFEVESYLAHQGQISKLEPEQSQTRL